MKLLRLACSVVMLSAAAGKAVAQGFVNLGFENTTITPINFPGGDRYTATIPGWSWNTFNFLTGESNTVVLNDITLDAPAVTLHGANSPFFPAIRGSYSVVLQGGTTAGGMAYGTNGASIFQTGQVPLTSQSLIYSGGSSLEVLFNGQTLAPVALSNVASHTVWGVNISAYAGQSGELRFTAPWLNTPSHAGAILDDIQFSPAPVPEPGVYALGALFGLCWFAIRRVTRGRASSRTRDTYPFMGRHLRRD